MDSKLFLGTKVTRPEDVRYSVNEGISATVMRFSRDRKLRGDTSRIGISESATCLGFRCCSREARPHRGAPCARGLQAAVMSSPSAFHGGDVASAIQSARASARPLLIALHPGGDDSRSASLDAVWADEDVRGELGDHWVAVRLEASTAAHRNFAQIYPAYASRVPSVVALDPNDGSVLFASGDGDGETSSLGVGTNAEATCGRLRETRAAFQKAMAAAAMAALARMAAASGAASASAAQTAPPAATQAATPGTTHLISPSASDVTEATPTPPRETRRDDGDALTTSPFQETKKDVEIPKEEEREKGKERDTDKEQTEKTSKRDEEASRPVTRTRSASFAARVTTPDGKTTTCELPPDATLGDFRAFVATLMRPLKDTSFEIWNAWPRERVDAGVEEDKTLESLGLGGRPSLLVVLPSSSRDQGKKTRRLEKKGGAAGAAAGGVLAVLAELIRRVWATLAMFLGIGDAGPLASGGGGETPRAEAAFGTQDAAWAAATRGVAASATPAAPASRARGGGGARGNVHTLGSSRDDDSFSDDRANRFDNGNSTVWGGDEGGDDGHTDAF